MGVLVGVAVAVGVCVGIAVAMGVGWGVFVGVVVLLGGIGVALGASVAVIFSAAWAQADRKAALREVNDMRRKFRRDNLYFIDLQSKS